MKIKKIVLNNIRSYKQAEIEFPQGSVLLSGDIGSGKSSILLAIEFALFGLQKGTLSGASLLRNGEDKANVNLNLEVDGENISIERSLKRGKNGISQDSGCITINGEKEELSIEQLRSKVLNILNYPSEFLKKNPILYKYTVYTPQEEMKQILLENVDERLNTLRRVFAVDKYKRIIENTTKFIQKLREGIRNKEGQIMDFEEKKQLIIQKNKNKEAINKNFQEIIPQLEKALALTNERKKELGEIEQKSKDAERLKTEFAVITETINSKTNQISVIKDNLLDLKKEVESLSGSTENIKTLLENLSKQVVEKNNLLKELNKTSYEISEKIASIKTKKESSEKIQDDITKLDNCPTCKQTVTSEHKSQFIEKTTNELSVLNNDLATAAKIKEETLTNIAKTEKILQELQEKEKQLVKAELSFSNLEKKKKEFENITKEIMTSNKNQIEIKTKLEQFRGIGEKTGEIRKNLDNALEQQKQIEIRKAQISEQLQSLTNIISELTTEITRKEKIKAIIQEHTKIRDWLTEQFVPLLGLIERNVMATLHVEFNSFFENWFNMLTSSESMTARLDENFTPIIEQAGYEMDYQHLSGGERTAAALAYRLALNQVINSLISHIKTRDLLILDEPTDGFSSEQLDKMRDVLKDINAKQLILVSHETKIEDFVDNILRFEKQEHITKIS